MLQLIAMVVVVFKFFLTHFKDLRVVAKYGISGSIAAASQIGVLAFLVEQINMQFIFAVIYAFIFSAFVAFTLQKFWTFRDRSLNHVHFQMMQYVALVLVAFTLNITLMYIFVGIFNIWYIFAQIITIGMVAVVTFLSNKIFIFNKSTESVRYIQESK